MNILVLRPLVFALVEYTLAIQVYRKGKVFPKTISALLFFLATYQLGEYIFLSTEGNMIGAQISLAATTMLPPLGILMIQRINRVKIGYTPLQILAIALSLMMLINPGFVLASIGEGSLIFYESGQHSLAIDFLALWGTYYLVTLSIAMIIGAWFAIRRTNDKHLNLMLVVTYASFYPTSVLISLLFNIHFGYITSFMCALAIIAAFIMSGVSLEWNLEELHRRSLARS